MNRGFLVSGITLICLIGMAGCANNQPDDAEDLDVVATVRDPGVNYQAISTYAITSSIPLIVTNDDGTTSNSQTLNPELTSVVLNEVNRQLQALGYTQVTDTSGPKPNVMVQISSLQTTNTQVYYSSWYSYWGGFYAPWYGSAYGVGWAPTVVPYVTSSVTGSLIIDMTNPNSPDPATQTIPSVWVAVVQGVQNQAGNADLTNRVIQGINTAFAQSPYLKK